MNDDTGRDVVLGRALQPEAGTAAAAAQRRVLTKIGQMDTGEIEATRDRVTSHLQNLPEERRLAARRALSGAVGHIDRAEFSVAKYQSRGTAVIS